MDEDCLVTDEATEERVIQFIELSPSDQSFALALLPQFKALRKVCPECKGEKDVHIDGESRFTFALCPICHGTGSIPVTIDDVEVRVKEGK